MLSPLLRMVTGHDEKGHSVVVTPGGPVAAVFDSHVAPMMRHTIFATWAMIAVLLIAACDTETCFANSPAPVSPVGLDNDEDGTNWPSYGRTYSENHASPLTAINAENIGQLGLAWSLELSDVHGGATVPLEIDGVIYFTVDQSKLHAVDALTGKLLWRYDPEVARIAGKKLRYTWGPRGIAYGTGKIYVGTTDGRLIAVDAKSGKPVWSVLTVDKDDLRTITGAPRVFDGLVIIGHAGADLGISRGYVTAYDAETGQQRWRFYTVPGNPKDGFESDAMKMAAKSWTGEWWKSFSGGTVWNAITYDPDYDTIYLGTSNGTPWDPRTSIPAGSDQLFTASIVALDAKTGTYKWHYQTNPGDPWDYDATQDMTLATMTIAHAPHKVLFQAPKNGFFYVIDRANGKLLSAGKYGAATWADHIDLKTGRPVEAPRVRQNPGDPKITPSVSGAHSWTPQSFNSKTGLVYIPTLSIQGYLSDNEAVGDIPKGAGASVLVAWSPLLQKPVWSANTPGFWNSGTMTTLGNLVFQGQGDGYLIAYAADSGKKLWSFYCGMGISGAPITYSVGGKQYVAVVAGWGGGASGYLGSIAAQNGWVARVHQHRLLTFALDGTAALPANLPKPQFVTPVDDPAINIDPEKARRGAVLYSQTCILCHGLGAVAAGFAPDLRASPIPLSADSFTQIVRAGVLEERGMPKFGELTDHDLENIRAYIRERARKTLPQPTSK
jgi:quinohemoprotein ethanol dehydrogenase